jgi:hypothetical protein
MCLLLNWSTFGKDIYDPVKPADPYKRGGLKVLLPTYPHYESNCAKLAAIVRGERMTSVSLSDDLLVAETVLRVGDMP